MHQDRATPARIAKEIRNDYISHRDALSATTIAATILFDRLIADFEDGGIGPVTFLTREKLQQAMLHRRRRRRFTGHQRDDVSASG